MRVVIRQADLYHRPYIAARLRRRTSLTKAVHSSPIPLLEGCPPAFAGAGLGTGWVS